MKPKTLVDTDVLSAIMRSVPQALAGARSYLADHPQLSVSLITRFEILRGLKAKRASAQLAVFDAFCSKNEILAIDDSIIVRAAEIYAELHSRDRLIPDADILIAATALKHGLTIATNNVGHFSRITGLKIDNWLA
jgi:tRNA(fMet)-specific endonuclease VapC